MTPLGYCIARYTTVFQSKVVIFGKPDVHRLVTVFRPNLTVCCVADHESHGQGHVWVLEWQPSSPSDSASCEENLEQAERASHIIAAQHQILKPLTSSCGSWVANKKSAHTSHQLTVWLRHVWQDQVQSEQISWSVSFCIFGRRLMKEGASWWICNLALHWRLKDGLVLLLSEDSCSLPSFLVSRPSLSGPAVMLPLFVVFALFEH